MSKERLTMEFTKEEEYKLTELRSRVKNIYPERDEILIAWLRARDLDVNKAEQMLRRHLIWRKNNEIDKLKHWISPKCFFPVLHTGHDFEGSPVFLMPIGKWELRAAIETGDIVPALRYIYQNLERVISACHEANVYQGIVLLDFDGFGYRQIAHRTVLQGILEVLRVFEANYPEVLKAAFVINAPKIFNVLFSIVKPFLHARTLAKVQIFNSDKRKWIEALLKMMAPDQLPPHWGGSKPGKDEYCSDVWFLEPLPKYFMRKSASTFDEFGDEWFQLKVYAGEKITLEYESEEGFDTTLRWGFKTEGYDIAFSFHYEDNEFGNEMIVPYQRIDSHSYKQEKTVKLERVGTYVLTFDNSYSRTRSKTLHYCVVLTQVDPQSIIALNNCNNISKKGGLEFNNVGTKKEIGVST